MLYYVLAKTFSRMFSSNRTPTKIQLNLLPMSASVSHGPKVKETKDFFLVLKLVMNRGSSEV